jgi:hypothetical protein
MIRKMGDFLIMAMLASCVSTSPTLAQCMQMCGSRLIDSWGQGMCLCDTPPRPIEVRCVDGGSSP